MIHLAIVLALSLGMKPTDLHKLRSVREVAIRPDGSAILYTELDPSGKRHTESRLMIYERESKAARLRVIYFWDKDGDTIYMLLVYPKNEQEDLTPRADVASVKS